MLIRTGKIAAMLCLVTILISFGVTGAEAGTKTVHKGRVVLKMNDYFIIYTYPKGPYIDENNRLIIPLRSVSDLLGAGVAYDGPTRTATVALDGHTVQITIGSYTAIVDGEPVEMDTMAVLENGSMLVPARILFDSFDFKVELNAHGVVCIRDERLYTKEFVRELSRGELLYPNPAEDGQRHGTDFFYRHLASMDYFGWLYLKELNVFQPLSYRVVFEEIKDDEYYKVLTSASYMVKNISGKEIAKGNEDFFISYYTMASDYFGTRDNSTLGEKSDLRSRTARAKDEIFIVNEEVKTRQKIKYILAIGRTILMPNETREYQLP